MAAKKQVQFSDYTPPPPCAHDGCGLSAYVKVRTKTGWANLCDRHYSDHFQIKARETCSRLGLKSAKEMRAWARNQKPGFKRFPVDEDIRFEREAEEIPF